MFAEHDKHHPSRSGQTSLATAVTNVTKPVIRRIISGLVHTGWSDVCHATFCSIKTINGNSVPSLFPSRATPTPLPAELSKYEAHLRQPVRIHNIRKKMAQMALLDSSPKKV